jgi:hypothetical protein
LSKGWILDTETKGTGANMVPLERKLKKPGADAVPGFGFRKPEPREPPEREPRGPHEFKIVDVMTREVLGEHLPAREAVDLLAGVRSSVDVTMYVWEPDSERWRMLTLGEQRTLWEHRRVPRPAAG